MAKALWVRRDVRGGYSKLKSLERVALITKEILTEDEEWPSFAQEVEAWRTSNSAEPEKPRAFFYDVIELYSGALKEEAEKVEGGCS